MKIEFQKSTAINNTYKTIYVVSFDDGDLITIEKVEYVDDSVDWFIGGACFHTEEAFDIEEILVIFHLT